MSIAAIIAKLGNVMTLAAASIAVEPPKSIDGLMKSLAEVETRINKTTDALDDLEADFQNEMDDLCDKHGAQLLGQIVAANSATFEWTMKQLAEHGDKQLQTLQLKNIHAVITKYFPLEK